MKSYPYVLLLWALCLACESRESRTSAREEGAVPPREEATPPEPDRFERPFDNTAEIDSLIDAIGMDVDAHPQAAAGQAFLSDPFGVSLGARPVSAFRQKIQVPVSVEKEPTPNRHRPSQIDTIYHLQFDSSTVSLYQPAKAERYMFASADIKSPNIVLKDNIRVGMSRNELLNELSEYKVYIQEQNNSIEVSGLIVETSLVFELQNGRVQRIKYNPYLD